MSSEALKSILQKIPNNIGVCETRIFPGGILRVMLICPYIGIGQKDQAHAIIDLINEARRLVDAAEREDGDE